MVQGLTAYDVAGTLCWAPGVALAPTAAAAVLALGTQNPNAAVPGLCSNLLTNLAVVLPLPSTDANGLIDANGGFGIVAPNTFPGASIYSQVHVVDGGRADAIKVCNSDGYQTTVPTPDQSKALRVTRLYNSIGGVTATKSQFTADTTIGYGLVLRVQ